MAMNNKVSIKQDLVTPPLPLPLKPNQSYVGMGAIDRGVSNPLMRQYSNLSVASDNQNAHFVPFGRNTALPAANYSLSPMTPSPQNSVNMNMNMNMNQYVAATQNVNYMNVPSMPSYTMMYNQPMYTQIPPILYGLQSNLYGLNTSNPTTTNHGQSLYQAQQATMQQSENESIKNSNATNDKPQCPPVSCLDTSGCRYHGQLYTVDISEQSIALKHVSCLGTEGRKNGKMAIAASQTIYEYVVFNAIDISQVWLDNNIQRNMTKKYVEGVFFGWPRD